MNPSNFRSIDLLAGKDDFLADVLAGLTASPKYLLPKYCYDKAGSQNFEEISRLDDYYVTRAEERLLQSINPINEVTIGAGQQVVVIELGGASSEKFCRLQHLIPNVNRYIPIDISRDTLFRSAKQLACDIPALDVLAICADYEQLNDLDWTKLLQDRIPVLYYPGSTLGNLSRVKAQALLRTMRGMVGDHGYLILGCDMTTDPHVLINAYDDKQGANARFNLHILRRINQELGGTFDLAQFRHDVRFNADQNQVEIYLTSLTRQHVQVQGHDFHLAKGESIHAELSRKFTRRDLADLAASTGFTQVQSWTDEVCPFAIMLWRAADTVAEADAERWDLRSNNDIQNTHEPQGLHSEAAIAEAL
jgi:dimethylhistidine N-methyltransferase